jgi:hypothetical protein
MRAKNSLSVMPGIASIRRTTVTNPGSTVVPVSIDEMAGTVTGTG